MVNRGKSHTVPMNPTGFQQSLAVSMCLCDKMVIEGRQVGAMPTPACAAAFKDELIALKKADLERAMWNPRAMSHWHPRQHSWVLEVKGPVAKSIAHVPNCSAVLQHPGSNSGTTRWVLKIAKPHGMDSMAVGVVPTSVDTNLSVKLGRQGSNGVGCHPNGMVWGAGKLLTKVHGFPQGCSGHTITVTLNMDARTVHFSFPGTHCEVTVPLVHAGPHTLAVSTSYMREQWTIESAQRL
eukprot:gnl/Dysnectes_brevis/6527_a10193_431.p1 GENE.gnl/Dysnectes_brevis/6527_a10193_431~~gnl/Dysnectes_brevis/6527_a10193_431.p1  ORF type:complete len:238 (-),score=46.71 gnl/Dysnectes_brevis/6527_a10193_431:111-824(-)